MHTYPNMWIKTAFLSVALFALTIGNAMAQVTATVGSITGRPSTEVLIPVTVAGNDGTDIQSFGFTVTADAGVTFTGVTTAGTLAGAAGFSVNANTTTGVVGAFSQGTDIATDGVLVYLNVTLGDNGSAGSIDLDDLVFNAGDPASGAITAGTFLVSDRIMSVADASIGESASFEITVMLDDALLEDDGVVSFSLDVSYDSDLMEIDTASGVNGAVASGITAGATVNGTAIDDDTYRIAGFTAAAMVGDGAFIKIAATSKDPGSGSLTLSNVVFNAGDPSYALIDGTLTVNETNFAPVFTAELSDISTLEDGDVLSFTYEATDVNGDDLTFATNVGTINATTGAWTLDPAGNAGVHVVTVTVTDGVNTATTSATVTIKQVDLFAANLAGVNEVPPALTSASGTVSMRMVADDGLLEVDFSSANLSGTLTGAHIHIGDVGENGGVSINLAPTGTSFTASYSISNAAAIAALRTGGAYVNVHTTAYPAGELRGQLLSVGNDAPNAATTVAPASVVVQGDPGRTSFSIAWMPVADPDGDKVNYILQVSANAAFTEMLSSTNLGVSNGTSYTVSGAADLYDTLTDATAGQVNVGGSSTFYHRVVTTDGSLWKAGPISGTTLTRGTVTDSEQTVELPAEFVLTGNYPNPFNPTTTISFDLPETTDVSVQVLDLLGRVVLSVPSQTMTAGSGQTVQIDASNLSSGIYLYRVIARGSSETKVQSKTMTLLK